MKKPALRGGMKKILQNLDQRWLRSASLSIAKELAAFLKDQQERRKERGEPAITQILAWLSFFPGEADLSTFISDHIHEQVIYLPRSLPGGTMDFWAVGDNWVDNLETGSYGIPEPSSEEGNKFDLESSEETLVLVPGLAFDRRGNRLGRGKGHYDRFFADVRIRSALKVGIGWQLQIVDKVPAKDHDVPMDYLVHEDGFLSCSQTTTAHIDLIDSDEEREE